jgi:hypothetical protein
MTRLLLLPVLADPETTPVRATSGPGCPRCAKRPGQQRGFRLPDVAVAYPGLASRANAHGTGHPPHDDRPGGCSLVLELAQSLASARITDSPSISSRNSPGWRSELEGAQLRIQYLRRGRQRAGPRGTSERGVTPECQPREHKLGLCLKLLQLMVRADTSGSGVARQIYLICGRWPTWT